MLFTKRIALSYNKLVPVLVRSLTDAPATGEVITATMSLQGKLPGNEVDAAQHLSLSATSFNFTTDNCCARAQTLEVTTLGAHAATLHTFRAVHSNSLPVRIVVKGLVCYLNSDS